MKILGPYLSDIAGIYLVGSYARNEETKNSDIDILVITNKTNKRIKQEKYELILISKDKVEIILKKSALPLLPMLKEAKSILNERLIKSYKNAHLTKLNLEMSLNMIKSALNVNRSFIDLSKEDKSNCSNAVAYSLILNLRSVYIIECLIKNTKWTNKELQKTIKKITGSLEAYNGYLRIKNDENSENKLDIEEAEKLYAYILNKLKKEERWLTKKR